MISAGQQFDPDKFLQKYEMGASQTPQIPIPVPKSSPAVPFSPQKTGGMTIKGLGPSGPTFVNPEAEAREAGAKKRAQIEAEKSFETKESADIIKKVKEIDINTKTANEFLEEIGRLEWAKEYSNFAKGFEEAKDKVGLRNASRAGIELALKQARSIPSTKDPNESFLLSIENIGKNYLRRLPEMKGFKNTIDTLVSNLAKVSGQVGMLSEPDVARLYGALNDLGSAFEPYRIEAKKTMASLLGGKFGHESLPEELKPYFVEIFKTNVPFKKEKSENLIPVEDAQGNKAYQDPITGKFFDLEGKPL